MWDWFEFDVFVVAAEKKCLKRGVKEVVKSIRKGNKGSVISGFLLITFALCYSCCMLLIVDWEMNNAEKCC